MLLDHLSTFLIDFTFPGLSITVIIKSFYVAASENAHLRICPNGEKKKMRFLLLELFPSHLCKIYSTLYYWEKEAAKNSSKKPNEDKVLWTTVHAFQEERISSVCFSTSGLEV